MRLASLIRRSSPFTPLRAGIPPTWDRPDPPATAKTPRTRRLTMEEKHFSFFDGSSPTYMLVNSEVAQGDLIEAFPNFAKRLGVLFLTAAFVGILGYLWSSKHKNVNMYNYLGEVESLQVQKKQFQTKYGLKDLQNNPWKLNSWPEIFPAHEKGQQSLPIDYPLKSETVEAIRKVNKEGLTYFNNLYERTAATLRSGNGGHH